MSDPGDEAMTSSRMLAASVVAERLGVSPRTVERWCREGLLEAVVDHEVLRPRRAGRRGWWQIPVRLVEMAERGELPGA